MFEDNNPTACEAASVDSEMAWPAPTGYLSMVLNSIGDAVIATDPAGRVRFVNLAATTLIGCEPAAAIGKALIDLFVIVDEETELPATALVARTIRDATPFDFASRFLLVRTDGETIAINGSMAPLLTETGTVAGTVVSFRDIRIRKRHEQSLQESITQFRAIFESASDGINIYEEDLKNGTRRLVDCNERYAEMAGRSKEELLRAGNPGKFQTKVSGVTPNLDNWTLRSKRLPYRGLISWLRPDGKENIIEYAAMPVEIHGKPFTIGLDRDITERVKMQEALDQHARELAELADTLHRQKEELQTQNEELDAFAHTVAHDLKTPLTIILAAADLLSLDYALALPADEKDYFQAIIQSSRKMQSIIDDLLLMAATRQQNVPHTPLDMGSIVAAALEQLDYAIVHRQPVITSPSAWPVAQGYGPWVERVWVNYISNAIHHGGDPLHIGLGATPQADGSIRFWVQDNGPGLTAEQQAQLFTPFTRLSNGRTKGHGLGLSIVHRIVKKLGGTVGVQSEPGQGSIFSFTLPAAE